MLKLEQNHYRSCPTISKEIYGITNCCDCQFVVSRMTGALPLSTALSLQTINPYNPYCALSIRKWL
jgi:orotate phosphoribosyltransferase